MPHLRPLLLSTFLLTFAVACTVDSTHPDGSAQATTGGALNAATGGDFSGTGASASAGGTASGGTIGTGASASTGGVATGGVIGSGGAATGGASTGGAGSGGGSSCPYEGNITYTLAKAAQPTTQEQEAYDLIVAAMDEALGYYNCYTDIERTLNVQYNPGVATADGNPNGSIRFGQESYMNHITAMHEMSHVFGVGDAAFNAMVQGGVFTGAAATAKLREITGDPDDQLHSDGTQHFWPYGLNYTSEVKGEQDLLNHCALVMAIREDLGL